jgi:hypothetical protein
MSYRSAYNTQTWACAPPNPVEDLAKRELRRIEDCMHDELRRTNDLLAHFSSADGYYNDLYHRYEYGIRKKYERLRDDIMNDYRYNYSYRNSRDWELYNYPVYYTPTTLLLENKMPTETKAFIIISSAGAAKKPIQHKTLAEAETEATRLAKEFPAQEFTVYETKKSFKVEDKPITVKTFV